MQSLTRSILVATSLCIGLLSVTSANAATCPSVGCDANWLNVPGDFANPVNNFTMHLLGGWFNVDSWDSRSASWKGVSTSNAIDTVGNQINFTASQFDHVGLGQGTSYLSAQFNRYEIGASTNFMGSPVSIYIDGQASGTLVDNADSTKGHWTLDTHLFAHWYGNDIDLGIMPLSTNASYSYGVGSECNINNVCIPAHSAITSGNIMDYHSGLAYMVGQGVIQGGPFPGFRVTIGLQGQDPLVAPVPAPSAVWLLGSGLLGLISVARTRRKSIWRC